MKVPHADLILEYAKDCQIEGNVEPWKGWEQSGTLLEIWTACRQHPCWQDSIRYRRKPRTITINGFEVPEPLREAPELDSELWIIDLDVGPLRYSWDDSEYGNELLNLGLFHLTREAAILHTKALLSFTAKGEK